MYMNNIFIERKGYMKPVTVSAPKGLTGTEELHFLVTSFSFLVNSIEKISLSELCKRTSNYSVSEKTQFLVKTLKSQFGSKQ
jgi:hypothetical protein